MAHLLYYKLENLRHADLHQARCTLEDAREAIRRWSKERGFGAPSVRGTSGRIISRGGSGEIKLNTDRLNWLLVAHEFAHTWDLYERPLAHRWHDSEHASKVDILCAGLRRSGWMESIPAERRQREAAATAKVAEREERQREQAAAAAKPEVVRATRITQREQQVARLERRRAQYEARLKAIDTRLKRARRSLAALQRAATKEVPT